MISITQWLPAGLMNELPDAIFDLLDISPILKDYEVESFEELFNYQEGVDDEAGTYEEVALSNIGTLGIEKVTATGVK